MPTSLRIWASPNRMAALHPSSPARRAAPCATSRHHVHARLSSDSAFQKLPQGPPSPAVITHLLGMQQAKPARQIAFSQVKRKFNRLMMMVRTLEAGVKITKQP